MDRRKLNLLMLLTSPWLADFEKAANHDVPEPPDLDIPPEEPGPETDTPF